MPALIESEVMLLSWSETSSGGAKIVLQLPDPDALEPFKRMTLATKSTAGQRLMAVFAVVEEGEPEGDHAHRTLGPLALLAVRWCRDPKFLAWAGFSYPDERTHFLLTQEEARALILDRCKIGSRRELDLVPAAGKVFNEQFRVPFMEWLRNNGEG